MHWIHRKALLKQTAGPIPDSDSVGLEFGSGMSFSKKCPGNVDPAGGEPYTLRTMATSTGFLIGFNMIFYVS